MNNNSSFTFSGYLLITLLLFQGISGVFGGAALVYDPSGDTLQMPLSLLAGTPFSTYLIPGLILLILLGIFPIFVAYIFWKRWKWSQMGSLAVGLALITWIGMEIAMIGYQNEPPLQAIYGAVGFLILLILPFIRNGKPAKMP